MIKFDNDSVKKALVMLAGGLLLAWLVIPKKTAENNSSSNGNINNKKDINKKNAQKPVLSDEYMQDPFYLEAHDTLCSFIDYVNSGLSKAELQQINDRIYDETGWDIYEDSQGRWCMRDAEGDILAY